MAIIIILDAPIFICPSGIYTGDEIRAKSILYQYSDYGKLYHLVPVYVKKPICPTKNIDTMTNMIIKRLNGIKHIPVLYREVYQHKKIEFILLLVLFPLVLIIALVFGRSKQRDIGKGFGNKNK